MNQEVLSAELSRRTLIALPLVLIAPNLLGTARVAHSSPLSHDNEVLTPIINTPLVYSGSNDGRLGGVYAEKPLYVPEGAELLVKVSFTTEIRDGQLPIKGGGLFIENGLPFGHPNFARIIAARIKDSDKDRLGIHQVVDKRLEEVFHLADGMDTTELEISFVPDGNEGQVKLNNEPPSSFPLTHSIFGPRSRSDRLLFAVYSQGETTTIIHNLEALTRII